jgi:putative transposase
MANTYSALYYHVVFSTKNRDAWLTERICERLWPYLGGVARENGMKILEVGGVADHVHILLLAPPTMAVAKAVQLIKGASSHWMKETFPNMAAFAWQDGYGAFSVSESQLDGIRNYIQRQGEHHRTKTFAEEYRAFLERHRVQFDERYLLGCRRYATRRFFVRESPR